MLKSEVLVCKVINYIIGMIQRLRPVETLVSDSNTQVELIWTKCEITITEILNAEVRGFSLQDD